MEETQHIYIDSVTVQFRCYNNTESGHRHTGQLLAKVEFTRLGSYIRGLPGAQMTGSPAILSSTLRELADRIEQESGRFNQLLDSDPFAKQNQESEDDEEGA